MQLIQIDRRSGLTREEFIENYLKPKKPVVFTDLAKDWPAMTKWTPEFLKENYGYLDVPVIGPDYHKPGPNYMKSGETMNYSLKKVGGEWKVAFDKNSVMGMGMDKLNEKGVDAGAEINSAMDSLKMGADSLSQGLDEAKKALDSIK